MSTIHHEALRPECTRTLPRPVAAAVQCEVEVRPVAAVCRVRPLNVVDWRRGDYVVTSGQRPVASPEEVRRDPAGDRAAGHVTPLTGRRCVPPPSNTVPRPVDDCAISLDDVLMSDHDVAAVSSVTVYDNVDVHLHV